MDNRIIVLQIYVKIYEIYLIYPKVVVVFAVINMKCSFALKQLKAQSLEFNWLIL